MIILSHVSKNFGNHSAVTDLNMEVGAGEIFGFLGPNGAGKSTTIRMLAGILRPSSGRISIGSYDMAKNPVKAKSITGYIPDKGFLYEKLNGREFLQFVAALYGMDSNGAAKKIDELASIFSIDEILDELIENYSAGMKQRLVFVSALLHDPGVLLIDEPVVGLDPRGMRMLKRFLGELASKGVAIFLATHSLALAEEMCTRIGIIHKGRLIASGTKEELLGKSHGLEDFFLRITEEPGINI